MRKNLSVLKPVIIVFLFFLNIHVQAQIINTTSCDCDHVIAPAEEYVDGKLIGAGPGDVVCIAASNKKYLGLINFHGTAAAPIIFKNCGGLVLVQNSDWYYGIRLDNCRYFRLTGSGDAAYTYGIKVAQTPTQIPGLNVGDRSTNFEIDHIEVSNAGFAGIMAKTDPECSGATNRDNFVMRDVSIHDNYVHNVAAEGIYVGFPHYNGIPKECDSVYVKVLPHEIMGLKIYNNKTENTGREGLQVGCAVSGVEIFNNTVVNFGQSNIKWQRAGVHFSTGTTGNFFSNTILGGKGPGIWLNGHGDNNIFNNLIAHVGSSGEDGIMVHDSSVVDGKAYNIINNTIVSCGAYGMKVYTDRNTVLNFVNNIVTGWGSDAMSVTPATVFTNANNVFEGSVDDLRFKDPGAFDFHLKAVSPAVDAGMDMSAQGVINDYEFIPRFRGKAYDAGAFESPYERLEIGYHVYPNPVFMSKVNLPPVPSEQLVYVKFILADDTEGSLKIYDSHGRVVGIISEGPFKGETEYDFSFSTYYLNPGVYFYILETANEEPQIRKVLQIE